MLRSFLSGIFLADVQRKFKRKNDYPVILRILGFFSSSSGRKIHHPRFQDRMCGFSRFQERFSPKKALVLVIFLGCDLFSQRVADFERYRPILFRWLEQFGPVQCSPLKKGPGLFSGPTVDGRSPAPVEVGSLSHYFEGIAGSLPSKVCYLPGG